MTDASSIPPVLPTGRRDQLQAYGLILLAATIWGGLGVMAKELYASGVSPWTVTFFRSAFALPASGLLIVALDRSWLRVRLRDLPFLALYALVGTSAFFVLYLFSISLTSVAVAVVLLYTAPAMAVLMSRFAFREAITRPKVLALLLSFVGCGLVAGLESGQPASSPLGIVVGLGSAFTYALFGIMSKQARRSYNALTTQFYALAFGTLFLLPVLALPEVDLGPHPAHVWWWLAAIALGPTLLARVAYVAAVKHVEASRAAIVATVEPVAAALFAFLFLGEMLTPTQLLGGLLVVVGAALAQGRAGGRREGKTRTGAVESRGPLM